MTTSYLDKMGDKRMEIVEEARDHLMRGLALLGCSREQMGRLWPVIVLEFPLLGPPIPTSSKSWGEETGQRYIFGHGWEKVGNSSDGTDQTTEEVQILKLEVTEIRPVDAGTLKALASIKITTNCGPIEIMDFKVIHQEGKKAWVSVPQAKWKNEEGKDAYKNLIELPPDLKKEVFSLILEAYHEKE